MKKALSFVLAVLLVFSLAGCGATASSQPAAEQTVVTDMIGREVTVNPGTYQRVVCIGAGALRMYSYIGDVNLLCGVEDIDNANSPNRPAMFDTVARPYALAFGDVFSQLPSCGEGGPTAQTAEAEKILSCNPDIVISEYEDVEKATALEEQLGIPVITLSVGTKGVFDEKFYGSMELLGKVFGQEEKAAKLTQFVKDEEAAITARVKDIADADKPSVYVCGLGIQGIGPIEEEKFVELGENMDVMILDAAAVKNIKPLFAEDPTMFDSCKAWQNGEIYLEMAYNAYYTNFEIALANTWFIAKTVYPEAFADIDMTEKTNQITQAFLGMELADKIFACPASYGGYQKIDTNTFFN